MFGGALGGALGLGQALYNQNYQDAYAQHRAAMSGNTYYYNGQGDGFSAIISNCTFAGKPKSFREELQIETDAWLGMLW